MKHASEFLYFAVTRPGRQTSMRRAGKGISVERKLTRGFPEGNAPGDSGVSVKPGCYDTTPKRNKNEDNVYWARDYGKPDGKEFIEE